MISLSLERSPVQANLEGSKEREIRMVFDLFEQGGKGVVRTSEIKVMLESLGVDEEYLDDDALSGMRIAMDPQRVGLVNFEAFCSVVGPCIPDSGSLTEQFKVFRMFDQSKKGYITKEDLERVSCTENGGVISPAECASIIHTLRSSSRPGLTFDEFKRHVSTLQEMERI